jgi:exonuclease SbcC
MRLNSIRLCNFRQHIDTRIEFDLGITGIIGPNGSGKSTILEAIAWALYGMPAARGKRESIRSYKAKDRAQVRVELDFELGGHRYVVSRGMTNAEVYLDGASAPVATSISGVSDLLTRRLGMSREEFFNTYFTGQKELGIMAAMGAADRGRFLSRVLGYERLRDAQDLVRKRKSAIESETKGLRAGMPDPEAVAGALSEAERRLKDATKRAAAASSRQKAARAALDEIAPRWEAMQRERDTLQALVAELRVADNERAAQARDLERIQREVVSITAAREELVRISADIAGLPGLQLELRELERASNEESRRKTLNDAVGTLNDELTRLGERRAKIETAPALEVEASEELARARAELVIVQGEFEAAQTSWVRDRQDAETKREHLIKQLRDVEATREQVISLGEEGLCPICGRALEGHMRDVLSELDAQIESIKLDGKFYRQRMDQLAATPPEVIALDERRRELFESTGKLATRHARIQAAVQELNALVRDVAAKESRRETLRSELATIAGAYDANRHVEVRALVTRLTPLAERATKLSTQVEREEPLLAEQTRVANAIAQIEARIVEQTARRAQIAFSEESFAQLRDRYEAAASDFHVAELAAVAAVTEEGAARRARESAEQARDDLARAEARLAELSRDRRLHDEWDRGFGEIRTDLNQEMRPELSDRASAYIDQLTDGRYSELQLDEQYNVIVLEDGIPKPVISGGEEDLANLVLRLAISEMIAERAGQPFSLLILDEVFGSLDETRRHNVVDLLRKLRDRFEQVILITHIETVREGVDQVVAVRYDEDTGISRVDMELGAGQPQLDLQAGAAD